MPTLQRGKPFLHQDKELFRAFRERSVETEPHREHGQRGRAGTWRRSPNPNQISMSLQNPTEKASLSFAQFLNNRDSPWSQGVSHSHRDQAEERGWISWVRRLFWVGHSQRKQQVKFRPYCIVSRGFASNWLRMLSSTRSTFRNCATASEVRSMRSLSGSSCFWSRLSSLFTKIRKSLNLTVSFLLFSSPNYHDDQEKPSLHHGCSHAPWK